MLTSVRLVTRLRPAWFSLPGGRSAALCAEEAPARVLLMVRADAGRQCLSLQVPQERGADFPMADVGGLEEEQ